MAVYIKYETDNIVQLTKGFLSSYLVFPIMKGVLWLG